MRRPLEELNDLRRHRQRKDRNLEIGSLVDGMARNAERTQRRLGALIDLWLELVPTEIVAHTRVTSFQGGVVQVRCDSAAVGYELDRALRSGLEQRLRAKTRQTLTRVRVTVGSLTSKK